MIASILSRLSVFNNGSVWALYLLHVIIRTALFCSLNILSDLKPHDNTQYCRWDRIKLLYKILNIWLGYMSLFIKPMDVLTPNLVKSWTREIHMPYNYRNALKFGCRITASVKHVKFQSDRKILKPYFSASKFREIWWLDVLPLSEQRRPCSQRVNPWRFERPCENSNYFK